MFSFIIPTFNRNISLLKTLSSLTEIDYPKDEFEIIVIDNGSTDQTKERVFHFAKKNKDLNLEYYFDDVPGLLTGRHRGLKEAKGDILIFIDDDIRVKPNVLQIIENSFNEPNIHLVGGKYLPLYESQPPKWLEYFWETSQYGGKCLDSLSLLDLGNEPLFVDARFVFGLFFAIRKQTLIELGGFHPDTMPKNLQYLQGDGETGLSIKINQNGYSTLYNPEIVIQHEVPKFRMTKKYFINRYYFQGVSDSYSRIRNGNMNNYKFQELGVINQLKTMYSAFKIFLKYGYHESRVYIYKKKFSNAYSRGMSFHNNLALSSTDILNWIQKDNYFNYKLPKIIL